MLGVSVRLNKLSFRALIDSVQHVLRLLTYEKRKTG